MKKNKNNLICIDGEFFTIEELKEGYKIVTGLDNVKDFSDSELIEYMRKIFEEG